MRKHAVRNWLKVAAGLNVVLFVLTLSSHFAWDRAALWPLLGIHIALLLATILLLAAPTTAPFERIETIDETPGVIVYPRDHG